MRKAASFVIQFLRGQSGGAPFEIVITLVIFGAVLAGIIVLFGTMYPGMFMDF